MRFKDDLSNNLLLTVGKNIISYQRDLFDSQDAEGSGTNEEAETVRDTFNFLMAFSILYVSKLALSFNHNVTFRYMEDGGDLKVTDKSLLRCPSFSLGSYSCISQTMCLYSNVHH